METSSNLSKGAYLAIGLMLFALFFGAGNLIFPAALGQHAGYDVGWALLGFVMTGVGLPLLGVLAIGYSGCKNVEELTGRVHPWYGLIYSVVLYLAIGPMFATPRTGTVAYEISVKPFLANGGSDITQIFFLLCFFGLALWLSINPAKLVNRIGKVLTPTLLLVILILIIKSLVTPLGGYNAPSSEYAGAVTAAIQGFLDGYNTMDALASLVFSVLVVDFVRLAGAKTRQQIMSSTFKAGLVAALSLAFVYVFIGNLGATSVDSIGPMETGAPVLAESAKMLFGQGGALLLAIIVFLACLTTAIGLITSCSTYFHSLYSKIPYKVYAVIFALVSFLIGLFGLKTIIAAAIPLLMLLYPLTIVIILLALSNEVYGGRRCVYAWTMGWTLVAALVSGLEAAGWIPTEVHQMLVAYIPFYEVGMGWTLFAVWGFVVGNLQRYVVKDGIRFGERY